MLAIDKNKILKFIDLTHKMLNIILYINNFYHTLTQIVITMQWYHKFRSKRAFVLDTYFGENQFR